MAPTLSCLRAFIYLLVSLARNSLGSSDARHGIGITVSRSNAVPSYVVYRALYRVSVEQTSSECFCRDRKLQGWVSMFEEPTSQNTLTWHVHNTHLPFRVDILHGDRGYKRKNALLQKYSIDKLEGQPPNGKLSIAFGLFVNLHHLSNFVWKWLCVEKERVLYCNYVRQAYNNYNNYQPSANNTLRSLLSIKIILVSNRYSKLSSLKLKGHRFSIFCFLISKDSDK